MKISRLLFCPLLALVSLGGSIPSVQAYEQGLPDHFPDPDGVGPGNQRYDYTYWAPTSGSTAWDATNWCWNYFGNALGDSMYRGIRWYEVTYPTDSRNNAMYAVFWDALSSGSAETFKTVDLNSDILVRGLHFRNEGWNIQDADGANTLTLISGSPWPSGSVQSDDRQAITMDTRSQATISANVVLGAFAGSSESSDGSNQYIAMGAQSALTISGNISETGAPKTLRVVGSYYPLAGMGSALTLSGNNTFTGGVTVSSDGISPYERTKNPRLNINSAQALGTGPLTVTGGPFILSNTSGAAVTIANSLVLGSTTVGTTGNYANAASVVADKDNLVFDGAHDLTVNGNLTLTAHRSIRVEDGGGDFILGGRILSDGSTTSSLFKNGPGTLVLSGTNSTYTGVTQINGGILEVTHLANGGEASSIGASANTVAKNLTGIYGVHVSTSSTTYDATAGAQVPSLILSNGGTLRYVGDGDSTDRLIGLYPGRRLPADPVTTPVSIDASGSGALKFTNSGDVVHIHNMNLFRVLNLTGTNTDDNTFNLALTDITGNTSPFPVVRNQLTKTGTGKWILTGTNTHTGGTTISDGTLQLGDSGTVLADTGAVIVNGGTFRLGAANETIGSLSGIGGTVDLFNGSGRTLTLGGSADANYAGAIVGAGGSLVKTGASTQTLSGANSYTGPTTITGGTLQFAGASAFSNGTIDSTTAARLTVNPGATAGFNVGGAGEFTSAHLDTLRAHGHFAADSFLGLDPSNAPGSTFTYASDIAGTLGLAKLGTGTLVLDGLNSYTGPTAVRSGTLAFSKTTAFYGGTIDASTAAKLLVASGATAQFNIGGTGEFSLANVDTLLGNGGFAAGSSLGLDTTNTPGGTLIYASNLGGAFGLTKAGSGTLVLAGANTYSGPTTVTGGTLQLNDAGTSLTAATDVIVKAPGTLQLGMSDQTIGSLAGDGLVHLQNGTGRALTLGGSTNTNFAGTLTGAGGSVVKSGTGRQTLSGTNTYDGATLITGGTLQFAKTSAFYNGTIDATTAARLSVASGSVAAFNVGGTGEFTSPQLDTVLGNGNFAAGSVLGLDTATSSGGTFTHAGTIGGGIGLAKLGTGTLVLSGANSYTGATTVGGGILQFANTSAFYGGVIDTTTAAKLSLTSGSTVTFNIGGTGEFTADQINTVRKGGGFLSGSFLGFDTTNAIGGVAAYGTGMVGSHGLVKSGSGTLILSGYNNYQGLTSVLDGTLHFAEYFSLYTGSGNNVDKLSVASGATATFSVGTGQNDFTVTRLPVVFANAKFASGSTLGLHTNTDFTWSDVIAGAFTLRKFGGNTLTLTAVNSYTGGTLVTEGTLQLGVDDALGRGRPAVTVDGGTLALGSFRQNVGAFVLDSGAVTGNGSSLIFGTLNADSFDVRSGSITANLAGSGALTKSGPGTVVLTGANRYTGATTISGGTLQFTTANAFYNSTIAASDAAKLSVASGATAQINIGGAGQFTSAHLDNLLTNASFASGSHLSLDTTNAIGNFLSASNIANPISLTKLGPGTLILDGTNTYTGPTTISGGTLQFAKTVAFPSGIIDASTAARLTTASGATAAFNVGGTGEFTSSDLDTLRASGHFAAGSFFGLDAADAPGGSFTYASDIDGALGVAKVGGGTVVLDGTNSYTGTTDVRSGTLLFGDAAAFYNGVIDANTAAKLTIASGATGAFGVGGAGGFTQENLNTLKTRFTNYAVIGLHTAASSDVFTWANVQGEVGRYFGISKLGSGTVILAGSNYYLGGTHVAEGTLRFDNNLAFYDVGQVSEVPGWMPSLLSVAPGATATFDVGGPGGFSSTHLQSIFAGAGFAAGSFFGLDTTNAAGGSFTYANSIGRSVGFAKSGTGTLVLTGSNTYTGGTRITGGTLVKANHDAMGTGIVVVEGGVFLIENGITAGNAVILSGGAYDRALASNANLAHAVNATSSFAGGKPDTTAMILDGILTSGTTLQTSFANTSSALNDEIRLSDVYSFHGTGSDLFVLELSMTSIDANSILGWLDADGNWVNAILGNTGPNDILFLPGAYDGNLVLGHYGVDTANHSVWAVINHNSDFAAVVPEPSIWALLTLGLGAILFRRRRQRA